MVETPLLLKEKLEGKVVNFEEEAEHFRKGKSLDCLITSPELWVEEFSVIDIDRPTGKMNTFIHNLPNHISRTSAINEYKDAYEKADYKINIEKVVSYLWDDPRNRQFFLKKKVIGSKLLLTKSEYKDVLSAKRELERNEKFIKWFRSSDTLRVETQKPIYFKYRGIDCKGLLDSLVWDDTNKIVYPVDLKSTGKPTIFFEQSFIQYGYFRQAAFYTEAVHQYLQENNLYYTIYPFQFVVVEIKEYPKMGPIIWETSEKDIDCGMNGGFIKDTFYKGINQLIDDYKWHKEHDLWEYTREVYLANQILKLKVFDDKQYNDISTLPFSSERTDI